MFNILSDYTQKYGFTFAMIKPNAVSNFKTGDIISKIERNNFCIHNIWKKVLSIHEAQQLYKEHSAQPFFQDLCQYICSQPVVLLSIYRENSRFENECWKDFRELIGSTDPATADPQSIRGMFGESRRKNAIHASDSNESAKRELKLFFNTETKNVDLTHHHTSY